MVTSSHDVLHVTVIHIIGMATHGKSDHSNMDYIHLQRGGDSSSYYTPTQIYIWSVGGSSSIEMALVSSLHDVLHTTVFQLIGTDTHSKGKYLCDGLHAYIHWCADNHPCYTLKNKRVW